MRKFDKATWDLVDDQYVIGLSATWHPEASILGLEADFAFSVGTHQSFFSFFDDWSAGTTMELSGGPRIDLPLWSSPFRINAGLGPSLLYAGFEDTRGSDSDITLGLYAHAGFWIELGDVHIGVDYRVLGGTDTDFNGRPGDSDYRQVTFVVGFHQ